MNQPGRDVLLGFPRPWERENVTETLHPEIQEVELDSFIFRRPGSMLQASSLHIHS